jgi:hypothetical protein
MMLAVDNSRILSSAGLCLLTLTERIVNVRFSDMGGGTCGVEGLFVEDSANFFDALTFFGKLEEAAVSDRMGSHFG